MAHFCGANSFVPVYQPLLSSWMRGSGAPQSFLAWAVDGRLWAMREALMVGRGAVGSGWQVPVSLWTGSGLTPHPSLSLRGLLLLALMTGERSIYLCAYRSVWMPVAPQALSEHNYLPWASPLKVTAEIRVNLKWCRGSLRGVWVRWCLEHNINTIHLIS